MVDTTQVPGRMADPRVLGFYGLAGATFLVGTRMAGWYGTSGYLLASFIAIFGLVQLLAGMWSYARRDDLATAVFGMWGAFWLGYGILDRPGATPTAILTAVSPEVAFGFIVLAAITWMTVLAATADSWALVVGLTALAAASTLGAIAEGIDIHGLWVLSGWLFAIAGVVAWYTSTALLLASSHGHDVLPLGTALAGGTPAAATDIPRTTPVARRVS